MGIYDSITYMNDLDYVWKKSNILDKFIGKTVFITGATGLIGSAVADLLLRYSEMNCGCIKVYVAGRDENKVFQRFERYKNKGYFHFVNYEANELNSFDFACNYVIHCASVATPSLISKYPIETMLSSFIGMKNLLDYAVDKNVNNTVFVSSSEVYGKRSNIDLFCEHEYGYIDFLNPRSSYPVGKIAAETLCVSYCVEKNINVSIVRPGHVYGPTASRYDNRVSSQFAYDAADGKNLILKSKGTQQRSYCYMLDCATAILTVLISGKSGDAYNISNQSSIKTIYELSRLYADYGKVDIEFEVPEEMEKRAFNPMENSGLDSRKLCDLGWNALYNAEMGTEHTIKIIKEANI